jgi:hypothetical protein
MGGSPYLLAAGVPFLTAKNIKSNWPKGIIIINCHHPLAFKSWSRLAFKGML